MHGPKQPSAALITGKHATRSIGSVRRRRQPHNQEPGGSGSQIRNRPRPIFIRSKRTTFLLADLLTMLPQSPAAFTLFDLPIENRPIDWPARLAGLRFWGQGLGHNRRSVVFASTFARIENRVAQVYPKIDGGRRRRKRTNGN
jgi:hypothetical protein